MTTKHTRYQPGVCNIGPAEIARRRRTGYLGLALTIVDLAAVAVFDVPPAARFLVALPAGLAAIGFLQAHAKFCAGYGSLGLYNFGPLGTRQQTMDPLGLKLDRRRALGLYFRAGIIAAAAGLAAALLPL